MKSHFYHDRIVVVRKKEVDDRLHPLKVDEKYFFKPSGIFLVENGISD